MPRGRGHRVRGLGSGRRSIGCGAAVEGADGNDEPHVFGDDVERQNIDFGGQIRRKMASWPLVL